MTVQIPDTFPSRLYHWTIAEKTKTKNGFLKVTFETKEQYKATLDHPWQMVQSAVDDDCQEVWLYVKGTTKPEIKLVAANVISLGRRLGFIGHPGNQVESPD